MKILLLCAVVLLAGQSEQVDRSVVAKESGFDVVEAVVSRIHEKCVFDDDKLFLRRLAFVESQDGTDGDTFAPSYFGGIWKVDEDMFTETKSWNVTILNAVKTEYGIDWAAVTWNDLLKPLYSGLAARLYLHFKEHNNSKIPYSLADQANYWVTHYRHSSSNSQFISRSKKIPKVCNIADVAFMIEADEGIPDENFQKMKEFVKTLISQLSVVSSSGSITNVKFSLGVYGDDAENRFFMKDHTTVSAYQNAVDSASKAAGYGGLDYGLDSLAQDHFDAARGARDSSVPKIAVILMYKKSDFLDFTLGAAVDLLSTGVKVFVAAIGDGHDLEEVKAVASNPDCDHLFFINDFNELGKVVDIIEKNICEINIDLEIKENTKFNCASHNPCYPSVIVPGKYYYPHTKDNKYVQCSAHGQCYEMPCPSGLVWHDKGLYCS